MTGFAILKQSFPSCDCWPAQSDSVACRQFAYSDERQLLELCFCRLSTPHQVSPFAGSCHFQQPQAKQTAQREVNLIYARADFCGDPPAISLKASRMQKAEYVPMDAFVHDGHGFRRPMAQLLVSPGCRRVRDVLRRHVDRGLFRRHSQLLTPRSDRVGANRPLGAKNLGKSGMIRSQKCCKRPQRIARVLFPARFEFPL